VDKSSEVVTGLSTGKTVANLKMGKKEEKNN
jgi:hypothetical protein